MATIASSTAGNYLHYLDVTLLSQNVAGNYSTLSYNYIIHRNSSASNGAFTSTGNHAFYTNVDGQGGGGARTFDFRAAADISMASGTINVAHNADGTKTISASFSGPNPTFSTGFPATSGSGSMVLPTIARASNSTFSANPVDAGTAVTINTNRASGSFTHDIYYSFGSIGSTLIASGVGDSTSWTPPMSLLNEIPNALSGTASIRTVTWSGGTYIGETTVGLTVAVPASVVPDFTTVTNSEATTTPNVATLIGAYVKDISKLNVAITGAVGAYGSTITNYKIEVAGQTINAVSGVTTTLGASGSLTLRGTVTDSRGRSVFKDVTITVMNYAPPAITALTAGRSNVGGTLLPAGTYLKINLKAVTQSLVVGTQKNNLKWAVKTRLRGSTTPWSSITPDGTATLAVTGFDDDIILGTYSVSNSYDIRVEVTDKLGSVAAIETVLSTGGVQMHLSRTADGTGFGKYWEKGSVDALEQMWQRNGKRVLDEDDLTPINTALTGISGRNKIINGNFRTNQRGIGSTQTFINKFGPDRWSAFGRINIAKNPSGTFNTDGWVPGGNTSTITRITGQTVTGAPATLTTAIRATATGTAAGGLFLANTVLPLMYVIPGRTYTFSAYVRASAAKTIAMAAEWKMDGGGALSASTGSNVALTANTWTRISVTGVAPANAGIVGPYAYTSTAWAVGQTLDITGVLIEESATVNTYIEPHYLTFTVAPQGQTVTLNSGQNIGQTIERSDVGAGTYVLSWTGTATGRVYNVGATAPAFAASGTTWVLDGLADVVVEFTASGGTKTLGKVQLELGTVPTAYEELSVSLELLLCQRYYIRYNGTVANERIVTGLQNSTNVAELNFQFPVKMRGVPRIGIGGSWWITDAVGYNLNVSRMYVAWAFTGDRQTFNVYVDSASGGTARYPIFLSTAAAGAFVEFNGEFGVQ